MIIVGSFLTDLTGYRDIDVLVVVQDIEDRDVWSKRVHDAIIKDFPLKIHVFALWNSEFARLKNSCPLTISMLYRHVSNMNISELVTFVIDKNRILFLLMLPEDALEVIVDSRTLYDCFRRVVTIERFLNKKSVDILEVVKEVEKILGLKLFECLKMNGAIDESIRNRVRFLLRERIKTVKGLLVHG